MIGTSTGDVKLTMIDIDSNKNLAIGGYTTDTSISGVSNADPAVIVGVISNTGSFKFIKAIPFYEKVVGLRFTKDN